MGSGGIAPLFLTLALDGGEWSASRPDRFTPGERALGIYWIGGLMSPRIGLNLLEEKIPTFAGNQTPPYIF
jgi:hypothetical protein